jgi:hypothetical protein
MRPPGGGHRRWQRLLRGAWLRSAEPVPSQSGEGHNWTAAVYVHRLSREGDPCSHTHWVVLNRTAPRQVASATWADLVRPTTGGPLGHPVTVKRTAPEAE